jgi:hypothetical protein
MPRFSRGARVRFMEEKTTGRVGTVIEVLPRPERGEEFDRYRVEFSDGEIKTLSDMELAPSGSPSIVEEDAA